MAYGLTATGIVPAEFWSGGITTNLVGGAVIAGMTVGCGVALVSFCVFLISVCKGSINKKALVVGLTALGIAFCAPGYLRAWFEFPRVSHRQL